jgi:hypothetical protein
MFGTADLVKAHGEQLVQLRCRRLRPHGCQQELEQILQVVEGR